MNGTKYKRITTEEDFEEFLEDVSAKANNESKNWVFRGQDKHYQAGILPSAARKHRILNSDYFDELHNDLRGTFKWITHKLIARSYADALSIATRGNKDALDKEFPVLDPNNPSPERKCINFLVQMLMQHYGRTALFVDVTKNPYLALWFACHEFIDSGGTTDCHRKIFSAYIPPDTKYEDTVMLYTFNIHESNIIRGKTLDEFMENYQKHKNGNALCKAINQPVIVLLDVPFLTDAFTRLQNQEAMMLSKLPADDDDYATSNYNVIDIVSEIYEVRKSLALNCAKVNNLTIEYVYPKCDLMYCLTKQWESERINMIQKQQVHPEGTDCFLSVIDWMDAAPVS